MKLKRIRGKKIKGRIKGKRRKGEIRIKGKRRKGKIIIKGKRRIKEKRRRIKGKIRSLIAKKGIRFNTVNSQ